MKNKLSIWNSRERFFILFLIFGAIFILAFVPSFDDILPSASLFAQETNELLKLDSNVPAQTPTPSISLWNTDWSNALNILATLLLASVLSGLVSYRRHGGISQMDFTEAHVVLATASAMMMMIIGSQIARAFGLMGAASIVRYRYSLKSPKEASSLVIALGIGMACGVGLYPLAIISSLYIIIVINLFEYLPSGLKKVLFPANWMWNLKVRTTASDETLTQIKDFLSHENVDYKIKRVIGDKGPNNDITEIEVLIFGNVNRNLFAEELSGNNVIRVRWKQEKIMRFKDMEID